MLGHDLPGAPGRGCRQVPKRTKVPQDLREPFRELLARALTASIRDDFSRPSTDADLADLTAVIVVSDGGSARTCDGLEAELFLARGQFERAFREIYLSDRRRTQFACWRETEAVGSRSAKRFVGRRENCGNNSKLPRLGIAADRRERSTRRISALQAEAAARSEKAQLRFVTLFHSDWPQATVSPPRPGREIRRLEAGFRSRRTALLRQLAGTRGDRAVAAAAVERLARLMLEFKLAADAAADYIDLERRFADVSARHTQLTTEREAGADALRESAGKFPGVAFRYARLACRRHSSGAARRGRFFEFCNARADVAGPSVAPFFAGHRLEVESSSQRLDVIDGFSDELYWSVPLRSRGTNQDGGIVVARTAAHQLTLLHQGVLHGLSPVDRKVLWTKPVENRGPVPNMFGRNLNSAAAMQTPANLAARQAGLHSQGAQPAGLCLASSEIVGTLGRRTLTVFDAITGEVAWTQTGCLRAGNGTIVPGGEKVVLSATPPTDENALAVRAIDGKRIETKTNPGRHDQSVVSLQLVDDRFVMSGSSGGKAGLRLFDPVAGRDLWALELPAQAKISILDNDRAALIEPDGKFGLIDLKTGQRKTLATISAEDLNLRTESFVVADHTSLFLLLNKGPPSSNFSDQVPFIRASGAVLAFDLETGKQRWKQVVQQQNLLLERLTASPFLLFSNREYKTKGRLPVWSLHLVAIDKLTGTKLLDEKTISQPGFRSVTVNAADRYVELRSYSERLRLYPADKPASAGQSGGD